MQEDYRAIDVSCQILMLDTIITLTRKLPIVFKLEKVERIWNNLLLEHKEADHLSNYNSILTIQF